MIIAPQYSHTSALATGILIHAFGPWICQFSYTTYPWIHIITGQQMTSFLLRQGNLFVVPISIFFEYVKAQILSNFAMFVQLSWSLVKSFCWIIDYFLDWTAYASEAHAFNPIQLSKFPANDSQTCCFDRKLEYKAIWEIYDVMEPDGECHVEGNWTVQKYYVAILCCCNWNEFSHLSSVFTLWFNLSAGGFLDAVFCQQRL